MRRYHGSIEFVSNRRAIITLTDARGGLQAVQRLDLPRAKHGKQELYELGYNTASTMAAVKGGLLDSFKELK